jgi:hypothetical protein
MEKERKTLATEDLKQIPEFKDYPDEYLQEMVEGIKEISLLLMMIGLKKNNLKK